LDRVAIGKRKQPSSLSRIGELLGHFYGLTILILSLFQTWLGSYLFSSWSITTEQLHLMLVFCEIVYSPQENTQASLLVPSCWCRPGPQCQGLLFLFHDIQPCIKDNLLDLCGEWVWREQERMQWYQSVGNCWRSEDGHWCLGDMIGEGCMGLRAFRR
jgi:hypothetical protein